MLFRLSGPLESASGSCLGFKSLFFKELAPPAYLQAVERDRQSGERPPAGPDHRVPNSFRDKEHSIDGRWQCKGASAAGITAYNLIHNRNLGPGDLPRQSS